jgi:hypothetical protein
MALVLKDRVLESSTSTGTGSFTLTGAQTGYQSFSAIGNGNTTYYTIQGKNADGTLTGEWEVGIGTWSTGNTLSRDTVLSNSLGTTAKIVFSAGVKDVFCDYPASKSVNQNADNKVLIPYTSGVTNVGSLNVGNATAHTDSGVIAAFTASEPLYLYTSLQNTSSANTSYASYAVNDGGHTSYGELGINNSNYSYSAAGFPNNTFSAPLATFVESYGGPLAIGTWDSQKISFIVNGSVNTTDAMTINAAGTITIPSLTASQAVFTDASKNLVSKAVTGTGSVVLNNSPDGTIANSPTFSSNINVNGVYIGTYASTGSIVIGQNQNIYDGSGDYNTIVGYQAFENNYISTGNTIIGANAYKINGGGPSGEGNNTIIGYNCLPNSASSYGIIAIGANISQSTNPTNSIYIGNSISTGGINEIIIGGGLASGNNITCIGTTSTTDTILAGTTSVNGIQANGDLQLLGSATANQNIATNQTTGNLTIGGASATGSTTLNGNVKLATKASLPTASAGLIEYDGLAFYNSIASSTRGVMPSEQFVILDTPYTLTSQTAAQKLFNASTNGAVTLPVGTYEFECQFVLTSLSALANYIGFAMVSGTAVIGSQLWVAMASKVILPPNPVATLISYNTTANTQVTSSNTGTNATAFIRGIIKITTAGTIIPSVSMSVAAAAIVSANSYFKISPVSKTNAANIIVGNWS